MRSTPTIFLRFAYVIIYEQRANSVEIGENVRLGKNKQQFTCFINI